MARRAAIGLLLLGACASPAQNARDAKDHARAPSAGASSSLLDAGETVQGSGAANTYLLRETLLGSLRVDAASDLRAGEIEIEIAPVSEQGFGELTRRGAAHREERRVRTDVRKLYPTREAPGPHDRACTFVVDCDAPDVVSLVRKLKARFGDAPTSVELERFTSEAIPKKNLSRGFDIASVVARRGEGDCTEHAVLLAALARSVGIPARVVTGFVLTSDDDTDFKANGHAWTEIYVDGAFRVEDGALVDLERKTGHRWKLVYLPITLMRDETVSFVSGALTGAGFLDIQSVRAPPAGHFSALESPRP